MSRSNFIHNAGVFVDFFFALSGFVVSLSYADKIRGGLTVRRFIWLRLGRIYPLHAVMMLVFGIGFLVTGSQVLTGANGPGSWLAGTFLAVLALVQIFVRGAEFTWNGPSWSIAAEMWTYVVFALLFKLPAGRLVPIALTIMAVDAVYMGWLGPRLEWLHQNTTLLRALSGFCAGYLASRIVTHDSIWFPAGTIAELVVTLVLTIALSFGDPPSFVAFVPTFFMLAVLVFAQEQGVVSRALMTPGFALLGRLSFSIYMIHIFIQFVLRGVLVRLYPDYISTVRGVDPTWFGDAVSLAMLAIVVVAAMISYHLVEAPLRAWSRRKSHLPILNSPLTALRVSQNSG